MLFTSPAFVVLVLITLVIYYLLTSQRWQVSLLIVASLVFYAWNFPALLSLLLLSMALNWGVTMGMLRQDSALRKKWLVTAGVVLNLAILAFFKYAPLIGNSFFPKASAVGDFLLAIPLPIGISFFTFQGISLVVDVHRGREVAFTGQADRPVGLLAKVSFYLAFFPQLVAGPIVKAHEFLPQISRKYFKGIAWESVFTALVMGYFLKMVVADNLKDFTFWMQYPYFINLRTTDLIALLLGYSVQIFADFAGYSLIAIGIARLFGYRLPDNFNFPYLASSFAEFWRRWHISLSTFLKEYLYIPLGGNRKGKWRTYINLLLTMVLGGLWHGAAWSYAVWGAFHGLALALERLATNSNVRLPPWTWMRRLWVFGWVTLGWLLFRLPEFGHVIQYLESMLTNKKIGDLERPFLVAIYCLPVLIYHLSYLYLDKKSLVYQQVLRPVGYGLMLFLILTNAGSAGDFIYFQF